MASSGWEIAMRRIDSEFDLPQFLASALVRKIAANEFRLPGPDRSKFAQLPVDVIARIEQIVRESYLDTGEDVGGETLRDHLWRQALARAHELTLVPFQSRRRTTSLPLQSQSSSLHRAKSVDE